MYNTLLFLAIVEIGLDYYWSSISLTQKALSNGSHYNSQLLYTAAKQVICSVLHSHLCCWNEKAIAAAYLIVLIGFNPSELTLLITFTWDRVFFTTWFVLLFTLLVTNLSLFLAKGQTIYHKVMPPSEMLEATQYYFYWTVCVLWFSSFPSRPLDHEGFLETRT